ncbi:unnamed protein product [Amoebophrya sp. A120]|nr:unnamed protein product [Amoebophrya sp. A120]|eukprot:GSA120T00004346001.1
MGQVCTNNFSPMTAAMAERELRSGDFSDNMASAKGAANLIPEDEKVLLAYELLHKRLFFTDRRIILQSPNTCCFGAKDNLMRFIPYSSIGGYSVTTPGSFLDNDCEMELYTKCKDQLRIICRDFACTKASPVPVMDILQLLNEKCLPNYDPFLGFKPVARWDDSKTNKSGSDKQGFFDWVGGNAVEKDPSEIQAKLQGKGVLQPAGTSTGGNKIPETVVFAFKDGRDMVIFTNKRFLVVDVQGFTGNRVSYQTVLYEHIRLFSVETAGEGGIFADRDSTLCLFTNLPGKSYFSQDLKRNIDIKKLAKFLIAVTCGNHQGHRSSLENTRNISGDLGGVQLGPLWWLTRSEGNAGQIDAREADQEFHRQGVLLDDEKVEMGFKGRKDYFLFTTKRVLFVDNMKKGLFGSHGKATNFLTVPYHSISHFAVQTPGGRNLFGKKDGDCEVQLWTDSCCFIPEVINRDDEGRIESIDPPQPWVTFLEQDLARDKVDLIGIHQYLSEKLMARPAERWQQYSYQGSGKAQATTIQRPGLSQNNNLFDLFISWATDDAKSVDAQVADQQMHEAQLLATDEQVMVALRCGRDLVLLTSKRVFLIDAQGFTGKKVQYLTIPYQSCRQFGVKCAGDEWSFDLDCELELYVRAFWNTRNLTPARDHEIDPVIEQDLRRGSVDLPAIQGFLADRIVLNYGSSAETINKTRNLPDLQNFRPEDLRGGKKSKGLAGLLATALSALDRNNFAQLSNEEVNALDFQLKSQRILLWYPNTEVQEHLELAFRNRKDLILFTNLRLLHIDFTSRSFFNPLGGNKCEYKSMPWGMLFDGKREQTKSNLLAYSFQSAQFTNRFDLDSTMILSKQVGHDASLAVDILRGYSDFGAISKWLDSKLVL